MTRSPSTIQILHNETEDITRYCLFEKTNFEVVGTSTPGTGQVWLKDPNRELSFETGDTIACVVDGARLWGGVLMGKGRAHFFPVVDTTDLTKVHDLQWQLSPTDYNIYMDKRVIRDTSNYLHQIEMKGYSSLGQALRAGLANYMDPVPGLDITTYVQDTHYPLPNLFPLIEQGKYWREQLDLFASLGGFVWYIDAALRLHFEPFSDLVSTWGFVDYKPNGVTSIGFREGNISEDGMQMVTDALVWSGAALQPVDTPTNTPQTFFARYPDPPANKVVITSADGKTVATYNKAVEQRAIDRIAQYGRWQRGEMHIGDPGYLDQNAATLRAAAITVGPPLPGGGFDSGSDVEGIDAGLNRPVWQVKLTWFAHDVPGKNHIRPGNIVPLVFYTLGDDAAHPLPLLLPMVNMRISFPTLPAKITGDPETYVRFDGTFGISYSDSRYLWRFLRARAQNPQTIIATVAPDASSSVTGALADLYPLESPNGSRVQFTLPFSYIAGSTKVYLNGLLQRNRYEYIESSPAQGIITFAQPPYATDTIWVECRTGG